MIAAWLIAHCLLCVVALCYFATAEKRSDGAD
jgi:hypothetical protein